MKKILIILISFVTLGVILFSCNKDDSVSDKEDIVPNNNDLVANNDDSNPIDTNSPFSTARVNTDVSNPEVLKATTVSGETITYYGKKNLDGTTNSITTFEYNTIDGKNSIIDFDETGRLISINNNLGVSIELEWLSATEAVIKAKSVEDEVYITTTVDFSKNASNANVTKVASKAINNTSRDGELKLDIINEHSKYSVIKNKSTRATAYDKDDVPTHQEVLLWIYQCDASYNAKNYLILKNASNGITIGKLMNYEHLWKGEYIYKIPISSYPSSASNKELCKNIDNAINNIEKILGGVLTESGALVVALNAAAVTTGIGTIPAVITDAIVLAGTGIDCGLQIFEHFGGVSALMSKTNSEWYYKEYIISDLAIVPVAYNNKKTVMGAKHIVKPTEDNILITLDMQGDPIISSFNLDPSHPGQHISYKATAEFNCIPEGSTIKISIVGTDGYSNSISKPISGSGSAVLNVPGAKSGVYDLCEVIINMPFGETLTMQASLVFGN